MRLSPHHLDENYRFQQKKKKKNKKKKKKKKPRGIT